MQPQFDVLIVGYGPVGQLLALQLGKAGLKVASIERHSGLYHSPRAVHYDHEVARLFQAVGVGDAVFAVSEPVADGSIFRYTGCQGQEIMRLTWKSASQSAWPTAIAFHQPELERILDAAVRRLPNVQVMHDLEATGLRQLGDSVELQLEGRAARSGEESSLTAQFLVGADGANSFVRSRMHAAITDLDFSFDWLVVNIKYRSKDTAHIPMTQVCHPSRPITVVPGGPGRQRFEFMLMPGENRDEMGTPEVSWKLLAEWGLNPDKIILERHAVYSFQARWAETWRDGRVLLAGDAAHVMPPFQAQGMCSGMRDAASLAWRLPLVVRGLAPASLLDSYGTERIPHVRTFIERTLMIGSMICISDPAAAAARDAMLTAAMEDPNSGPPPFPELRLGEGIVQSGNAHAGTLSYQGMVEYNGACGRFDDLVGRGFTLIGTSIDPREHLSEENRHYLDRLGAVVTRVSAGGPVRDVDGGYADWFARHGFAVALSRPDFYLFGAVDSGAEINALVDGLRTKLALSSAEYEKRH